MSYMYVRYMLQDSEPTVKRRSSRPAGGRMIPMG